MRKHMCLQSLRSRSMLYRGVQRWNGRLCPVFLVGASRFVHFALIHQHRFRASTDSNITQVTTIMPTKDCDPTIDVMTISPTQSHILVSLPLSSPFLSPATASDASALLKHLLSFLPINTQITPCGHRSSYASWLDVDTLGLWNEHEGYGGVVPCKSVWNSKGQRIAGVFAFWCQTIDKVESGS